MTFLYKLKFKLYRELYFYFNSLAIKFYDKYWNLLKDSEDEYDIK